MPELFWVGNVVRLFLCGLIEIEIFLGIQNNLKIRGSVRVSRPRSSTNFKSTVTTFVFQFLFFFFRVISFNPFCKLLRLGNLALDFLGVYFRSTDFCTRVLVGFSFFASFRSSPSLST